MDSLVFLTLEVHPVVETHTPFLGRTGSQKNVHRRFGRGLEVCNGRGRGRGRTEAEVQTWLGFSGPYGKKTENTHLGYCVLN